MSGLDKLIGIASKGTAKGWKRPGFLDQNRSGRDSEHAEQCRIAHWLDTLGILWFAVPSGEMRHQAVANRLKAEGVKRGISDIVILEPRGRFHGLLLEMKKADARPSRLPLWHEGVSPDGKGTVTPGEWKSSGLSDEQWEFLKRAWNNGYHVAVGYGFDHAKKIVEGYLSLR